MFDIDRNASIVIRKEVHIEASPETVWLIHADIDRWSQWLPDISQARLRGPLEAGTKFRWKSRGFTIKSRIEEVSANERLVWTGRAWLRGVKAVHVWNLQPSDEGALLVTEESLSGWMVRLFKGQMAQSLDDSLNGWLRNLKFKAEGVETRVDLTEQMTQEVTG